MINLLIFLLRFVFWGLKFILAPINLPIKVWKLVLFNGTILLVEAFVIWDTLVNDPYLYHYEMGDMIYPGFFIGLLCTNGVIRLVSNLVGWIVSEVQISRIEKKSHGEV